MTWLYIKGILKKQNSIAVFSYLDWINVLLALFPILLVSTAALENKMDTWYEFKMLEKKLHLG